MLIALAAWLLGASVPPQDLVTISIRGKDQALHIYGSRGRPATVLSSGDGGWIHLGPHVADVLAAHGYFVVGFDVKRYLAGFTSGAGGVTTSEEPSDYLTLIDYAARGNPGRPVLIGVSEAPDSRCWRQRIRR